jgi:hypothetical protein
LDNLIVSLRRITGVEGIDVLILYGRKHERFMRLNRKDLIKSYLNHQEIKFVLKYTNYKFLEIQITLVLVSNKIIGFPKISNNSIFLILLVRKLFYVINQIVLGYLTHKYILLIQK